MVNQMVLFVLLYLGEENSELHENVCCFYVKDLTI